MLTNSNYTSEYLQKRYEDQQELEKWKMQNNFAFVHGNGTYQLLQFDFLLGAYPISDFAVT